MEDLPMNTITLERNLELKKFTFIKVAVTSSKSELGKEDFSDQDLLNDAMRNLVNAINQAKRLEL